MSKNINDFIGEFSTEDQLEIDAKATLLASEMLEIINAETLKPIRHAFENTQADVARKLGVGQVAISKLEGRSDVYVSTLRRYLGAVGAELRMMVKLKDGSEIPLERFGLLKISKRSSVVKAKAIKREVLLAKAASRKKPEK